MHNKKEKNPKSPGQINEGLNDCTLLGSVHKGMQKNPDLGCQEVVTF